MLFGLLALGVNFSFRLRVVAWLPGNIYWGSFIVLLFVMVEELSQYFIVERSLDIYDFIAGGLGILIFTILTIMLASVRVDKSA